MKGLRIRGDLKDSRVFQMGKSIMTTGFEMMLNRFFSFWAHFGDSDLETLKLGQVSQESSAFRKEQEMHLKPLDRLFI